MAALLVAAAFALAPSTEAQTPLMGQRSDATTGPLLSGVVYHATTISVPAGATLTVQPDVIVKFGPPNVPGTVTPFGRLCAGTSIVRTPPVPSGGTPLSNTCWGEFTFDLNAWLQGGNDPNLMPGDQLLGQFWYRDGVAQAGAKFSPAYRFTVRP